MFKRLILALGLLCASAVQAQAVHGYVVTLKPPTEREATQGSRERMQSIVESTGLAGLDVRAIGNQVHVLKLKAPAANLAAVGAELRRLQLHPQVQHVEPDARIKLARVPNDTNFGRLWHLEAPNSTRLATINAIGAWDSYTGANNITVAILDSGIRPHPDLTANVLPGYDLVSDADSANDGNGRDADPTDPGDWVTAAEVSRNPSFAGCDVSASSWHGTFIAGLVAAAGNNGQGIAGVSWGARILPVRVAGKCGALLSDLLDGIRWAAGLPVAGVPINPNPARIINISFGGATRCAGTAYQPVIDEATAAGSLVVVAAGNEAGPPLRPADCRNVWSVGAVRADGMKTSYSNFGSTLTFVTTGGSTESSGANLLYGLVNTGTQGPVAEGFGTKQGTSFSAPVAAGIAALVASANPLLSNAELLTLLKNTSRPFVFNSAFPSCSSSSGICNCNVNVCGAGMLDANAALNQALVPLTKIDAVRVLSSGVFQTLTGNATAGSTLLLRDVGNAQLVAANAGSGPLQYRWRHLSGPQPSITSPTNISTTVVLGSSTGVVVLELLITDAAGRIKAESVNLGVVAAAAPVDPTPPANGGGTGAATGSTGGGAFGSWELLALLLLALGTWQLPKNSVLKKN